MAIKYWEGKADAVAQVGTASIDSVDATPANNTFTVTIGGVAISAVGDTDVATTATTLRASLNASTHPYFAAITWSGTTGDIIGTADTAGVPFVAALTETGAGTGAVTDFAATTASAGSSDWSTADNWSDGIVPVNADTIIIADSAVNISYGLDQNAVDLTLLTIEATYTGKIGLPYDLFTTSEDGDTTVATAYEYREDYLKIGADTVNIGQHNSPSTPAGSQRIKLNNDKAGAATMTVFRSASGSADTGKPAIRFLASNASIDIWIREAKGGVGIASDEPNETATVGVVSVSASESATKVFVGEGTTLTTYEQSGGTNILNAAATITMVEVNGGQLTIEGDYVITALNINNGIIYDNHIKTSGNAVTTLTILAGTLNFTKSAITRTIATLNPDGGTIIMDDDYVTVTTLDSPAGAKTISIS
jgi:hypothetical protein